MTVSMVDNITASGDLTHYVKHRLFDDGSDESLSSVDARNNYHFFNKKNYHTGFRDQNLSQLESPRHNFIKLILI